MFAKDDALKGRCENGISERPDVAAHEWTRNRIRFDAVGVRDAEPGCRHIK
jgi:hypothetical protein